VATASDDHHVWLWSVHPLRPLLVFPTSTEAIATAFSPDKRTVAVGDAGQAVLYPLDLSGLDRPAMELLDQAARRLGLDARSEGLAEF